MTPANISTPRRASNTVPALVRISVSDARQIARMLDNDLSQGLLADDAEWNLTQLLARLCAAINDPNAPRHARGYRVAWTPLLCSALISAVHLLMQVSVDDWPSSVSTAGHRARCPRLCIPRRPRVESV